MIIRIVKKRMIVRAKMIVCDIVDRFGKRILRNSRWSVKVVWISVLEVTPNFRFTPTT